MTIYGENGDYYVIQNQVILRYMNYVIEIFQV